MKNALLLAGIAVTGYGIYLFTKKKKDVAPSSGPVIVKTTKQPIYSSAAIESFDYDWNKIFPTPERLGIKNNTELNEEFGQNFVSE
jgi:hypothetical protein